jgi:hypothetical protein
MPNWCQNTLSIRGDDDRLDALAEAVADTEQPLSLNRIVPEPEPDDPAVIVTDTQLARALFGELGSEQQEQATALMPLLRSGDASGLINWRLVNWGCKWDVIFDVEETVILMATAEEADPETASPVLRVPGELSFRFLSPWCPPEHALDTLASQWLDLEFCLRYAEPGNDVAGEVRWRGGERVSTEALDVDSVLSPEQRWF